MSSQIISLAGEYAVASEICRRGYYAQLTLGNLKKTDILVKVGDTFKQIEVKTKFKTKDWLTGKKGFKGDVIIIFVDLYKKSEHEKPDFYIMTVDDWHKVVDREMAPHIEKGAVTFDENHVPVWKLKKGSKKSPWKGHNPRIEQIKEFKNCWWKIIPESDN